MFDLEGENYSDCQNRTQSKFWRGVLDYATAGRE